MGRVVIPGFRKIETSGGGEGGTTNYDDLENKPFINNVPLVGNLNTVDLKLTDKTLAEEGVPADAKTVGAKLEEHSTSLTALSEQLGNHTVKSDVPENAVFTDTVYDDTEVKGSIAELNSNLDGLGYGENTGSGNLFREEYKNDSLYVKKSQYQSYLKTNIKGITKLYATVKLKGTSQSNYSCSIGNTNILADKRFLNYGNISIQEYDFGVDDDVYIQIGCSSGVDVNTFFENYEIIISDSTITSDTPYEPYIPSVKMLAEEVDNVNESLSNKTKLSLELGDISWAEGNNLNSTTWKRSGFVKVTPNTKYTLNRTQTEGMNIIGYKEDKSVISDGIINQTSGIVQHCNTAEYEFTTTPTTNYIRIAIVDTNLSENITLTNNGIGNTVVELVEDVDSLKNDLDKLNSLPIGSIIQIDENKDDIEKTKQKYGWQYLGKSNIQYESGSATLLVTNVYRKNE